MRNYATILAIIGSVTFFIVGCGKNESAGTASALEKAFVSKTQAESKEPNQDQAKQVQQVVQQAVAEMRTNAHAEAYATLRSIQSAPYVTADQMMAINNAKLAIEHDVAAKAAAGDPAALKAVEKMKGMGH